MTVLSDYARFSYGETTDIEYLLDCALSSSKPEEFRWEFSEALRRVKALMSVGSTLHVRKPSVRKAH